MRWKILAKVQFTDGNKNGKSRQNERDRKVVESPTVPTDPAAVVLRRLLRRAEPYRKHICRGLDI
jgi:hypothetical protein